MSSICIISPNSLLVSLPDDTKGESVTGFTTESPSKRFVVLAETGRCENLLQALEIRAAAGYRVVQCWGVGGGQAFLGGGGGSMPMTYVLLEKTKTPVHRAKG